MYKIVNNFNLLDKYYDIFINNKKYRIYSDVIKGISELLDTYYEKKEKYNSDNCFSIPDIETETIDTFIEILYNNNSFLKDYQKKYDKYISSSDIEKKCVKLDNFLSKIIKIYTVSKFFINTKLCNYILRLLQTVLFSYTNYKEKIFKNIITIDNVNYSWFDYNNKKK